MLLHKEFGLNPTMTICVLCGNDTGEIALLGAECKGQAPMKSVVNNSTCKRCVGILFETNRPAIAVVKAEKKPFTDSYRLLGE